MNKKVKSFDSTDSGRGANGVTDSQGSQPYGGFAIARHSLPPSVQLDYLTNESGVDA